MEIQTWAAQQDWGSWADWFAALGTIAAVGVALTFGLRDGKRLRVERQEAAEDRVRFREQQQAEAEAQKRKLAARVSVSSERFVDDLGDRKCRWTVHNGSDEPISTVALVGRTVPIAGKETPAPFIFGIWASIEAHGQREKVTAIFGEGMVRQGELQFTDGAGQFWQRREFGALKALELDDPESIAAKETQPFLA